MRLLPTRFTVLALLLAATLPAATGRTALRSRTENVLFVMTDGLRWQEVFSGAEESLLTKANGGVDDVPGARRAYWRDSPEARRETLLPFTWGTLARGGQLYGNQARGSVAHVTNGKNFSYPGYSETFCGFADARIDSNDKKPNPNVTVFEWLARKPRFRSRVAAFGAWDVLPFMLNRQRLTEEGTEFYVNACDEPVTLGLTPRQELLNRLKVETPTPWGGEAFDSHTFYGALEYLRARKPRVLYVLLGETDEWAHAGRYADYLQAAQRADGYLRTLWETAQSMPEYRGKTTLIFTPDHGRGDAPSAWKGHGEKVAGSGNIWMGFLGPDTPALGERERIPAVTQSQVAATLAALLGEDYAGAESRAGKPIADVLGR